MNKKEYNKQYRERNRERLNAQAKAYYWSHRDKAKTNVREIYRRKRLEHPEELREYQRLYMLKRRLEQKTAVLSHYGRNNQPVCVICGESRLACLSIDHIDGGGRFEAKRRKNGDFYWHLIKEKFPLGFQTLCMNCQWVKREQNNECRRIF